MSDVLIRMFEPPEWFDPEEAELIASWFPEISLLNIYAVAGSLAMIEKLGKIPDGPLDIFEFGSGLGEGLISLDMLAKARGGNAVTGSEITDDRRIATQVSDILESVIAVEQNGIAALSPRKGAFDLVLANMFGPSYDNEHLPSRFIALSLDALKPGGVVVINSDTRTMGNVKSWAQRNLEKSQVEVLEVAEDILLPSGFIARPHIAITK